MRVIPPLRQRNAPTGALCATRGAASPIRAFSFTALPPEGQDQSRPRGQTGLDGSRTGERGAKVAAQSKGLSRHNRYAIIPRPLTLRATGDISATPKDEADSQNQPRPFVYVAYRPYHLPTVTQGLRALAWATSNKADSPPRRGRGRRDENRAFPLTVRAKTKTEQPIFRLLCLYSQ